MTKSIGYNYGEEYYRSHYGAILSDESAYELMSLYWKHTLFTRNNIDPNVSILDYGGGLGQVSAALPNVTVSDPSGFAREYAY